MVKSRITLQKALGTVVWHRAGGFALVQALLPDRLFIINGIVIANRVFGGNIGGFGGGLLPASYIQLALPTQRQSYLFQQH